MLWKMKYETLWKMKQHLFLNHHHFYLNNFYFLFLPNKISKDRQSDQHEP